MTDTKDKLKYQLKAYRTLGYLDDELPHFVAGEEIYSHIMGRTGTMAVGGTNWSISRMKYDSVQEMFDGAAAIYHGVRWRPSKFLADELIMPLEKHREKLQEKTEK